MPRKKTVKKVTRNNHAEYVESPVLRVGIVFFFIVVIALVAYIVKFYTP